LRSDASGIASQLETTMHATPIADAPVVDIDGALRYLERTQEALEFMRCEAVLEEFRALGSTNTRLIAWFEGRRNVLRDKLQIPHPRRRAGDL